MTEKLLINHEWVAPVGGSENVFRSLLAAFPSADGLCLWNDVPETFDTPVRESGIASTWLRGRKAAALPFMSQTWGKVDLGGYDAVLSSSHAFAHHLATRAARTGRTGFAYVHTPARYIWAPEAEARGDRLSVRLASIPLKRADLRHVDQRVHYAANSEYIRARMQRCWGVDAAVIYPPIAVERIAAVPRWREALSHAEARPLENVPTEGYVLGASRLVRYKRLDLVIDLGDALGVPVVIAGSGPEMANLRAHALSKNVPVIFLGHVSDAQLFALYQGALLFAFLAIEDFGIMPVECMATGTPVLLNSVGGASESIDLTGGGVAVDPQLGLAAIQEAARAAMAVDRRSVSSSTAKHFGEAVFRSEVSAWFGERMP